MKLIMLSENLEQRPSLLAVYKGGEYPWLLQILTMNLDAETFCPIRESIDMHSWARCSVPTNLGAFYPVHECSVHLRVGQSALRIVRAYCLARECIRCTHKQGRKS